VRGGSPIILEFRFNCKIQNSGDGETKGNWGESRGN